MKEFIHFGIAGPHADRRGGGATARTPYVFNLSVNVTAVSVQRC